MIIMGVDPGTAVTGIGVIEIIGQGLRAITYRAVKTSAREKLPVRLKEIFDEVQSMAEDYRPAYCAVEDVFSGKNIRSALLIGQARGAVITGAMSAGVSIAEYTPREIKMSVVGNGNASKAQVQFMVRNLLGLRENPEPHDCSGALAAALCHVHRLRFKGMMGK